LIPEYRFRIIKDLLLLIGILVPAVNKVRITAKTTATKALIDTLSTGLETFRADQQIGGRYPPSASDDVDDPYKVGNPYRQLENNPGDDPMEISGAGLLVWRIQLLAHREVGVLNKLRKALYMQPAFVAMALAGIAGLWLWAAGDAYRRAHPERRQGGQGIYVLIAVIFVILGWQTSQIDLYKLATEIPDAWSPLSRVIWPWEAVVTRETLEVRASADILVPCESGPAPAYPEEAAGQPYLRAEPRRVGA